MAKAGKAREKAIRAELKAHGAPVIEEDGGFGVHWAITEERVQLAAQFDGMTSLYATFCVGAPLLTGPELRHLRGHQHLRRLELSGMPIPGEYLAVLLTLPKLEELYCAPKEGVQEAMLHIGKCKGLRRLDLNQGHISDKLLESLRGLENLEGLALSGRSVSSGVSVVQHMKHLRSLSLNDTSVCDDVLKTFVDLRNLETLYIESPNVTDAGMKYVAKSIYLKRFAVSSKQVTSKGLRQLSVLTRLEYLSAKLTTPDASLFKALSSLKQLRHVSVKGTGVSSEDREELEALLPKCRILWM